MSAPLAGLRRGRRPASEAEDLSSSHAGVGGEEQFGGRTRPVPVPVGVVTVGGILERLGSSMQPGQAKWVRKRSYFVTDRWGVAKIGSSTELLSDGEVGRGVAERGGGGGAPRGVTSAGPQAHPCRPPDPGPACGEDMDRVRRRCRRTAPGAVRAGTAGVGAGGMARPPPDRPAPHRRDRRTPCGGGGPLGR